MFAPGTSVQLFPFPLSCHFTVGVGKPEAEDWKVADRLFRQNSWLVGCSVTVGGVYTPTVMGYEALTQPVVLLRTVTTAL